MKQIDEIFNSAVKSWRNNKGVGTMLCPAPLNTKVPILMVLERFYSRSPTGETTIIVNTFNDRLDLIDFLTKQENENNNEEFKKLIDNKTIKILTSHFVSTTKWVGRGTLVIFYEPTTFDEGQRLTLNNFRYKLIVLNKLISNVDDSKWLNYLCPILDEFKQAELDELRVSLPVEEEWIRVDIDPESEKAKLLEYYNKEITTSLNVFGSFEVIKQARVGNQALNISAVTICNQIAHENGWSPQLDMSTEYNQQIDRLYNPNALNERAKLTYENIRLRSQLLSDYEGKLEKIYEIVSKHPDDKFLIISKRGEFAKTITDYLNNVFGFVICGDYHDRVGNVILKNQNGDPILVKTGINKGKPRELGWQAQKTRNQVLFNDGTLRILSTSNAPDKNLNIEVDSIIITSPLCEDIKSYMYRLAKVHYRKDKINLYTIYCNNTLEYKQLVNKDVAENHVIVNKTENKVISENNSDFIIVD